MIGILNPTKFVIEPKKQAFSGGKVVETDFFHQFFHQFPPVFTKKPLSLLPSKPQLKKLPKMPETLDFPCFLRSFLLQI